MNIHFLTDEVPEVVMLDHTDWSAIPEESIHKFSIEWYPAF